MLRQRLYVPICESLGGRDAGGVIFFFKQKTAYEMRISDWSSDVCSSDLGREKILAVHMKKVPLAPDVQPRVIARGTPGFSGADLANLVNEAALLAARRGKRLVAMDEFEAAKDKVMMGTERKSMVMRSEERREGKECVSKFRCRGWPHQ